MSSKEQVQIVANYRSEGMWIQGKNSQETIVKPWSRVLLPPTMDAHNSIFELFCRYWNPSRWEKLMVCCPQACRPQTSWNQKVDDADSHLPHHQPIRRMSTSWSPSLNHYYTTPHYILQVGTHSFEDISPLWPPLPGKAIKLFFSASPKSLSLRYNSVSGYKGWF